METHIPNSDLVGVLRFFGEFQHDKSMAEASGGSPTDGAAHRLVAQFCTLIMWLDEKHGIGVRTEQSD